MNCECSGSDRIENTCCSYVLEEWNRSEERYRRTKEREERSEKERSENNKTDQVEIEQMENNQRQKMGKIEEEIDWREEGGGERKGWSDRGRLAE